MRPAANIAYQDDEAEMKRNGGTGKPTAEDKKRDGEKAMAEQRARADAVNKNMARLRAERLEREEAEKRK